MQKYINWLLFLIAVAMICLFFIILPMIQKANGQSFERKLFYMDTYISVKVFMKDSQKAQEILESVNQIYKQYHELTDAYTSYPSNNIYYINHNQDSTTNILIDPDLYELLQYGLEWYEKSQHRLNINMGSITSIWKDYREKENGIPPIAELQRQITDIQQIVLLENNKIQNTHPTIDLGAIAKGYATQKVVDYLRSQGIDRYLINAGGNVAVGKYYQKGKYKIGIEDPTDTNAIYMVVEGENMSVVTSGGYQRYFDYAGKRYHHIIDPNTLFPAEYMQSVTVIAPDSALADALSTTLFLMPVEEGQRYIQQFDQVAAIWYQNDGTIVKSEGFTAYEQK